MASVFLDPDKPKILFFSRGRGRGHAIPDVEIVRALNEAHPDIQVRFVSYGTGARTIEQLGFPLIDIGLPDHAPHTAMTVIAGQLIGACDPDLVISHEEFAAFPAAKIFNKPTVGIIDWFSDPESLSMACLRYADRILFIDQPGVFEDPPWVSGKVEYVGPILRETRWSRQDQPLARSELGIPADAFVIAVLPGSWTEEQTPIFDVVIEAYDSLDRPAKFLLWIAGADHDRIGQRLAARANTQVIEFDPEIERIMVAADVAVTKCTRKTHIELAALGTPALALYGGLNPIDQKRVSRLDGTVVRNLDAPSGNDNMLTLPLRLKPTAPASDRSAAIRKIVDSLSEALGPSREAQHST